MPKVLVANRGEIAIRILRAATELGWSTITIFTENDSSHAGYADESVELGSATDFMDVDLVVKIALKNHCSHVHPGYGFLSENPVLPLALAEQTKDMSTPIIFIGPSLETLRIASDKILSRELAISLNIPVAAGQRVSSADSVHSFANQPSVSYPVMIKALDGGGGRGIRVVAAEDGVEEAFKRCLGESPSRQVFVEKALTGEGWKHIEVQVIGDGTGAVNHLWERECSVQRRFQKVVELAPSRLSREDVQPLLDASLTMSRHLKYKGLGTFEYLFHMTTRTWVFLEINPRVQVEHTITEEVNDVDLVRSQLLLFSSSSTLENIGLAKQPSVPKSYAVQLRLTAEDPERDFQLSPGPIEAKDVVWPQGRGVRIDTWLSSGPSAQPGRGSTQWMVGTDFDSLLAKIIIKGHSFDEMTQKARRALRELHIAGPEGKIKTNVAVLAGVLDHTDWLSNNIDTLWLERNLKSVLELGERGIGSRSRATDGNSVIKFNSEATSSSGGSGMTILQPGTLFHLTLSPESEGSSATPLVEKHNLTLASIGTNAFPEKLSGTFLSSFSSKHSTPVAFELTQSNSAAVSSSQFELANPNDPSHVVSPMTGKVVELHPAFDALNDDNVLDGKSQIPAARVRKGEALLVLSVMKMESLVVVPSDGYLVRGGKGVKVGVVLGEGMLVCVIGHDMLHSRL